MKPALQISINLPDLEDALKTAKEATSTDGVDWIDLGKKLIKSQGLQAVKEFKNRFPDKQIIVDIDILGRSRKLKSVIEAGADILKISGDIPEETLLRSIDEFKKKGVKIMVDLTKASSPAETSRRLENTGIDYILVDYGNLDDTLNSADATIAVTVDPDKEKINDAINKGAHIIALREPINKTENIKETIEEISKTLTETEKTPSPKVDKDTAADIYFNDDYIEDVTHELDKIKKILLSLETQRKADEEHKLQMQKDMEDMEERFKKTLKIEQKKIEEERDVLREQMQKMMDGWQKLRNAEAKLEEKQRKLEEENQRKWETILLEFEEEMQKRLEKHKARGDRETEYSDLSIEKELEEIRKEWDEMEKLWMKIDKDKRDIEKKRVEIEEAWKNMEDIEKRGNDEIEDMKGMGLEAEVYPRETEILEKELVEVEKEWKDIEDIWGMIDEDKKEIDKQRREIEEEWSRIEDMKKNIEKEQEMIEEKIKSIEERTMSGVPETHETVSQIKEIRDREREELEKVYKEKEEIEKKRKEIEKAEEKIGAEKEKIKDEIVKLEAQWHKIKKIKKTWGEEVEIKKIANKAVADLQKLKKEHEKPREETEKEDTNEKTKTIINRLIDLVNEKEEVKLKDAAKELDVQEYLLRRWSNLLEKKQIIKIKAPLLGDVTLKKGPNIEKLTSADSTPTG